jgi:integrase
VYRYLNLAGKEREISIGAYPDLSLAEARDEHDDLRSQVRKGVDPLADRHHEAPAAPSFGVIADAYLKAHTPSWKSAKHRDQWEMTLRVYCKPIRDTPVDKIDAKAVLKVLTPLWHRAPETGSRLRGRIESIIASAQVQRHIDPDKPNPARWRGWLSEMLPNPKKLGERGHHRALDWRAMPELFAKLGDDEHTGAKALQFVMLTASRTSEVLHATWDEMDLEARLWRVPATRMRMARDHHVPLSGPAMAVLEAQRGRRRSTKDGPHPFVFPSPLPRRPLSNMSMAMHLRRMEVDATTHGMRAAFRSWCADHGVEFELAEAALAHSSGSVVAAYQRSAMTERRRPLMENWGKFLTDESAEVVQMPLFGRSA